MFAFVLKKIENQPDARFTVYEKTGDISMSHVAITRSNSPAYEKTRPIKTIIFSTRVFVYMGYYSSKFSLCNIDEDDSSDEIVR